MQFMRDLVSSHQTPALWLNILQHFGTYVMFWLSFRCADWDVRMGTFKLMARLFHAFDRQHYQELSGVHLANMWQLPPAVLQHLLNGAFTASVRGIATRN